MAKPRSFLKDVHNLYKNIYSVSGGQAKVNEYIEPPGDGKEDPKVIVEIAPNDGFYKGGKWKFQISPPNFPNSTYPAFPPIVLCLTEIYHPNIDMSEDEDSEDINTNICVSMLDDGEWQPNMTLEDCVQAILFLFYNPNWEDALSPMFTGDMSEGEVRENVSESIKGGDVDGYYFAQNYGYKEENSHNNKENELVNEMNKLNTKKTDEMTAQQKDEYIQSPETPGVHEQITPCEADIQNKVIPHDSFQSNEPNMSDTPANDIHELIHSVLLTTIENAISQVDGVHFDNLEVENSESGARSVNSQTLKRSVSLPASLTGNFTSFDVEQEQILKDIQEVKCWSKMDQIDLNTRPQYLFDNLVPYCEIMPLLTSILCDKVFNHR